MPPLLEAVARGALFAVAALLWSIAVIRVLGLRTLGKMTAFDFLGTLASGSLLATAASASSATAAVQALAAMLAILAVQNVLARIRRFPRVRRLIENEPAVLVRDGVVQTDALRATGVTENDLHAKLRAAGIIAIADVDLVILETTADVVILAKRPGDERLLRDVPGAVAR